MIVWLLPAAVFFIVFSIYFYRKRRVRRFSPFTENILRAPARSLREQQRGLIDELLFPFFCILMLPGVLLFQLKTTWATWLIVVPVIVWALIKSMRIMDRALKLRLGIDGEEYTGQELNLLMREGAWVFHDLPYRYGNIDHIVVSKGGVFTVETKAFRKPQKGDGLAKEYKVRYDGKRLVFPHFTTDKPLLQAQRHAKYLSRHLQQKLGLNVPVLPVVALPGWWVEGKGAVKVINPKRGGFLTQAVNRSLIDSRSLQRVVDHLDSVARSVQPGSKKMDPNATDHYDFWSNPRAEEPKLD